MDSPTHSQVLVPLENEVSEPLPPPGPSRGSMVILAPWKLFLPPQELCFFSVGEMSLNPRSLALTASTRDQTLPTTYLAEH